MRAWWLARMSFATFTSRSSTSSWGLSAPRAILLVAFADGEGGWDAEGERIANALGLG